MRRTVLITGVCGGLGSAAAKAFSAAGWVVVGTDRSAQVGESEHVDRFFQVDLAEPSSAESIRNALDDHGRLDALVNNAAVQVNRALVDTTDDEWALVMDTNVRAAFQMIRTFHPMLAAARGAIVNVSSVHAVATSRNVAAYAISKGALAAMTRTAAIELAAQGIRCNAVLPGAVLTSMLRDGLSRRGDEEGAEIVLARLAERTPLGFVATPEQIAPTIVHLADNELSPYTTGQLLVVDGGAAVKLATE